MLGFSIRRQQVVSLCALLILFCVANVWADPCGMVPPIYTGPGQPITRIGLQQTYVFYKDGIETFVIRPGFTGKVEEFGMLVPFPVPPALRKVPDHTFAHLAAAVDPPEIVIDLRWQYARNGKGQARRELANSNKSGDGLQVRKDEVRVIRQEAVGMYEVAVLEAGSAVALKRWMDDHGFKYPEGMDKVCEEYIEAGWCFVAEKTKVGQKSLVDPEAGQRKVEHKLPDGSTFDGHVQGMEFRFPSKELIVPMRLGTYNEGDLRNIVYLLTDTPQKIRSIPEEYVVRQISGEELFKNVTDPLPVRILGGTEADIPEWQRKELPQQRDPYPHNGAAMELFASDLKAVASGQLTLAHEEKEKELLAIGEALGLRGGEIDKLHEESLKEENRKAVADSLVGVKKMALTVLDGDFPREVLARKNLSFGQYKMPSRRNTRENYDAKVNGPGERPEGLRRLGAIDWEKADRLAQQSSGSVSTRTLSGGLALVGLTLLGLGLFWRRRRAAAMLALVSVAVLPLI